MPHSGTASGNRFEDCTDLELIEAIRGRSESAFTVLYERYFQRIHNFSYARLRNRADAEEVVQETFTAVFRSIDSYRGQSALLSWIYGIAKNTINNHLRRAQAHDRRIERAEAELVRSAQSFDGYTPEEQLNFQRCADAVQESLASVTQWQAEVFAMRHLENLSIQEIADRMSRSNDAIRSSLYRVKRLVVEAVDPEMAVTD